MLLGQALAAHWMLKLSDKDQGIHLRAIAEWHDYEAGHTQGGLTGALKRVTLTMRELAVAFGGRPAQLDHVAEALVADRRSMANGLASMACCLFVGWDVWWILKLLEVI